MTSLVRRHPSEDRLWSFADGELSSRDATAVSEHVATCPDCRTRVDESKQAFSECLRYFRTVQQDCLPAPPEPWRDIHAVFEEADARVERRSWRTVFDIQLPKLSWRWVALGAGAALVWAAAHYIGAIESRPALEPLPAPPPATPAPRPPVSPSAPAAQRRLPTQPVPEPATPAEELKVFAALHRLGADLGEPIEVTRGETQVVVTGVGIEPDLARRLREELSPVPRVEVRFSDSPPEVETPSQPSAPIPPQGQAAQFQQKLEKQLGGRAAFDQFADRVLSITEALMSRAHALRRLAERFPPEVESMLSPEDRAVLTRLRQDHATALRDQAAELERYVQPVLSALGVPAAASTGPWTGIDALLEEARRTESNLAVLLGGASNEPAPETLPSQTQANLARLRDMSETYARLIARQ